MARRADELLGQKALEEAGDDLIVSDHDSLQQINRQFWRGYSRTGIGLGVFMAGLLGLTAALGRTSATLFVVGVSSGIVLLAIVAVTVSVGGLRRLRSAHVGVDTSVRHLSGLPDRRIPDDSVRPTHRRRRSRLILFPRRGSISQGRDRARLSRVQPLGSSG